MNEGNGVLNYCAIFFVLHCQVIIIYIEMIKISNYACFVNSQLPALPSIEITFPLCTATDNRCSRNSVDLDSPDSALMRRPSSFRKERDFGPIAPKVSIAMGEKVCPVGRPWYLSIFLCSAAAATFPGSWVASELINIVSY